MKKNNHFLAFLLLAVAFNAYSMDEPEPQSYGWALLVGGILLGAVALKYLLQPQPKTPASFANLPQDIKKEIILLLSMHKSAESMEDAAFAINSLAQVNKELNALINDPKFLEQLIPKLAKQFERDPFEVVKALNLKYTKEFLREAEQRAEEELNMLEDAWRQSGF